MQTNSNHNKPFFIVGYTFLALLFISLAFPKSFWKSLSLNPVNILDDLAVKETRKHASTYKSKNTAPLKNLVKDTK